MTPPATLHFLSGPHEGRVFHLPKNRDIHLGRSTRSDILIPEDLVSGRHAKLFVGPQSRIYDLASRNGTFVNGERVQTSALRSGDRIVLGTSIARIDLGGSQPPRIEPSPNRVTASMTGRLADFPLPDVLQLLSGSRKNALVVLGGRDDRAAIEVAAGNVVDARLGSLPTALPMKAVVRMLGWNDGEFELQELPESSLDKPPLQSSTHGLLMEAMRHLDETAKHLDQLGGDQTSVSPLSPGVDTHGQTLTDRVHRFIAGGQTNVRACLDRFGSPDLEVLETLLELEREGRIALQRPARTTVAATPTAELDLDDPDFF